MNWTQLDWPALDRLRDRFLRGAADGPYWESESALASYDLTYGERIGWKWDAVLRELRLRGWQPPAGGTLLDWGCGSGVASRRVAAAFAPGSFAELLLWDHDPLAVQFAADAAEREFPSLRVGAVTPGFLASAEPIDLVVVSHVLSELTDATLAALHAVLERARSVIWVESATHATSRRLTAERARLLARFHAIAPCTHQEPCPMHAAGNERHWCHFFAAPPAGIFATSDWVKFGQRAGIDLRSAPYCFLALVRRTDPETCHVLRDIPPEPRLSRIIGRPENLKPCVRFLNCDAGGLAELKVPRRRAPALCRELERAKGPLVYRWTRDGGDVVAGAPPGA
jgi:SAM-dependent methyltransferase